MPSQAPLIRPVLEGRSTPQSYLIAGLSAMTLIVTVGLYSVYSAGYFYLSLLVLACFAVACASFLRLYVTWRMPPRQPVYKYYADLIWEEEL